MCLFFEETKPRSNAPVVPPDACRTLNPFQSLVTTPNWSDNWCKLFNNCAQSGLFNTAEPTMTHGFFAFFNVSLNACFPESKSLMMDASVPKFSTGYVKSP